MTKTKNKKIYMTIKNLEKRKSPYIKLVSLKLQIKW